MILNSSKLSTPSPSRSNLQIMALHSSISWCEPSLLSIRFRLRGVMHPSPFIAYIPNASFSPRHLSSSSASSCASFRNSSWLSSPSPSVSADATRSSASSADTSSPSAALMQSRSSAAEILPSSSRSNAENTRLNSDVTTAMVFNYLAQGSEIDCFVGS
ncbi:hypothetical protein GQ55_5G014100 [Panicum hallii var. hallii]|uniref:Uncharacterized protein n=1 Tax=Panicum hallii var. hallii TaxID=1504633 RepID=A0A2T7DBJ4_9POAL|nr:hypothetical protein GQ55_5G014100 [Panicum hallii var. hallii]